MAVAVTVWSALGPRLVMAQIDRLVDALMTAGDYSAARRVWDQGVAMMNLPPLPGSPGSVVWDSSFESGLSGNTFSWRYKPIDQGVTVAQHHHRTRPQVSRASAIRCESGGSQDAQVSRHAAVDALPSEGKNQSRQLGRNLGPVRRQDRSGRCRLAKTGCGTFVEPGYGKICGYEFVSCRCVLVGTGYRAAPGDSEPRGDSTLPCHS